MHGLLSPSARKLGRIAGLVGGVLAVVFAVIFVVLATKHGEGDAGFAFIGLPAFIYLAVAWLYAPFALSQELKAASKPYWPPLLLLVVPIGVPLAAIFSYTVD